MIETKRCFISGPMTGIEDWNRPAFMEAEEKLKAAGFSVFNPAWLNFDDGGFGNEAIMAIDIAALSHCNYIYQLEGWEKSKGASAEWSFALSAGIKFVNHSWLQWFLTEKEKRNDINIDDTPLKVSLRDHANEWHNTLAKLKSLVSEGKEVHDDSVDAYRYGVGYELDHKSQEVFDN